MNVTLRQLRAFVALARAGNFTRAAERLAVTQSALSGLIKELELQLGLRLFDRTSRRIQLTAVGREAFPPVEKILQDLDLALGDVASLRNLRKGRVRIAAPQLLASSLLPAAMAAFRRAHPEIDVQLIDCAVDSVPTRVLSGEVDLGVGPERGPGAEIREEPLFEQPFMVAVPPGHPLAAADAVGWAALGGYPVVSLEGEFTRRIAADLGAAAPGLRFEPAREVAFMPTAFSLVGAGLGVAVCVRYAAPLAAMHGLVLRPLVEPVVTRRFCVFARQLDTPLPAVDRFRAWLAGHVARRPEFAPG